ncbi:hypothetical protein EV401DRAFT_1949892, partial [Pisolithus croceorrhizus]
MDVENNGRLPFPRRDTVKHAMISRWDRFRRKGKKNVGVLDSVKRIVTCSWLNILILVTPVAWWAHFSGRFHYSVNFSLSFLTIIPHEKLFDFYGEQMQLYLGKDVGDLLTITLNNVVEGTLAIILLTKCRCAERSDSEITL